MAKQEKISFLEFKNRFNSEEVETPVTTGTKKGTNATEKGNHRAGSFFMQRC